MNQSHVPESDNQVLHALRCIGAASQDRVSWASGLPGVVTGESLRQLSNEGLVALDPGPFGGWGITEAGLVADDRWLGEELEVSSSREVVVGCYERFLGLNPTLLQICSDWQMRTMGGGRVLNDHSDPDYDAGVLSRLFRVDDAVQPMLVELTQRLSRFHSYSDRMESAIRQVMVGNHSYVADGLDSYHTIWFQLHEDLLMTLGISRGEEGWRSL
jgi:hypothetical protein